MMALTFWRPWPALIIWAGKRVENRPWYTPRRGTFAIHGGKRWDHDAFPFADRIGWPTSPPGLDLPGKDDAAYHPAGIVAVADLVDVCQRSANLSGRVTCDCGPWALPHAFHWRLDNIRLLPEPVPCAGKQSWWTVPPAVHAAIDHHLQGVAPC